MAAKAKRQDQSESRQSQNCDIFQLIMVQWKIDRVACQLYYRTNKLWNETRTTEY